MSNLFTWLRKSRIVFIIFLSISVLLIILAIIIFNYRKAEYKKNLISQIKAIGELKASEISTWLNDRIADASLLSQPSFLSSRLESYINYGIPEDSINLYQKILTAKANYNYQDVFIVDTSGKILIGTNDEINSISKSTKEFLNKSIKSVKNIHFDLYYCSTHQNLILDFAAPIKAFKDHKTLGYLILRVDPNNYLFPTLNQWPITSHTTEVALIKTENDSVIVMNNLRHMPQSALQIRFPLIRNDLVAVKVANNKLGIIEGIDYRNVKVLAYALKLPNTTWSMITKTDEKEIYRALHIQLTILVVILTLVILLLGVIFMLITNSYQKSYIKKLYDSELKRKVLVSQFEYLIKNANDIIILADMDGRIIEANKATLKAYQLTTNDIINLTIDKLGDFKFKSKKGISSHSPSIYETIHRRSDGSTFPVEINEQLIKIDDSKYFQAIIRDISQRKLAEERLLYRERVLKLFVDYAPAAIALFDTEMHYMACSKRFLIDYGLQENEVIGRSHYEIFPEIPQRWKDIHQRCLAGAVEYADQDPFPRADGSLDWIRWEIHPWFQDDKTIGGIFLFSEVITERIESKLALSKSEAKFRRLYENMALGVVYQNTAGKIISVNPAAEKLLGLTAAQLEGRTSIDPLWHAIHDDGSNFPGEEHPAMVALKTGKSVNNVVMGVYHPEKKEHVWILVSAEPEFREGESDPYQVFSTITDITALRKAEEELKKFRTISDLANYGNVIIDMNDKFIYVNDCYANMHGYTADEILGKNLQYIHPNKTDHYIQEKISKLLQNEKVQVNEVWRSRKDGTSFPVMENAVVIKGADGKPIFMAATIIDISEIRNSQEALRNSEESLNYAQEIAKMGNWNLDLKSNKVTWSKNLYKIYGLEQGMEEINNEQFYKIVYPDDLMLITELNKEMFRTRKPLNFDYRIIMPDQSIKWIQNNVVPIFEDNKLVALRGTNIDITEKKNIEEKLREQNERLNAIINAIPDFIFVHDRLGTFLEIYTSSVNNLVLPNDKIIGSKLADHYSQEGAEVIDMKIQECFQTQKLTEFEFTSTNHNVKRYFESRIVPLSKDKVVRFMREITEKRLKEEEIKTQNERLNAIIDAIPDRLFVHDRKGTFLEAHTNQPDKLLVTPNNLIGLNLSDLFDKEIADYNLQKIEECLNEQKVISHEFSFTAAQTTRHFEVRVVPMSNEKVLRFVREITDKKIKDEEIKKLSLAVEQSPVLIMITNLDGIIEYVNAATVSITGYSREELIGNKPSILKSGKQGPNFYQELWKTILAGKIWHNELMDRKKNGDLYWIDMLITPIQNNAGATTNYMAIILDISERKMAEKQIRELNATLEQKIESRTNELKIVNEELQQEIEERTRIEDALIVKTNELENFFSVTLDLLCIIDRSGNFVKVNKAWENILGFLKADLEVKKFWEFIHPDDMNSTQVAMNDLLDYKMIFDFVNRYRTKDGSYRFIEWRCVPFENLIYAAARDITERIIFEEELKHARQEAEKANAAKSEFLSRMSHELRTPMNSILGFAQLLSMDELNAEQTKEVYQIIRSGKHLLDLINEVLDISRIESGRLLISIESVKVLDVIQEVIDIQQPLAKQHNIQIELIQPPHTEQFVRTDKQRLKQVIFNLINNAIKYNKEGGYIKINTSLVNKDNNGSSVHKISITDSGIGIMESDIPNLFVPFERIGADKTQIEGTGLGLAVVKKLLDAMNGKIGVESVPGQGSTFWVELPAVESPLLKQELSQDKVKPEILQINKKGSILYIEDNASNIDLVDQILRTHCSNVKLLTCTNGKDTMKFAIEFKPDLILLDLNLPDIHGSEVLQSLQEHETTKKIPVVIVSADATPQQLEKLLQAGARKFLTKPIDVFEFLNTLNELID